MQYNALEVISMYAFMSNLLGDIKDGYIFTLFDLWHIGYVVLFVGVAVFFSLYLRSADSQRRSGVIEAVGNLAFGLYVADFFLMPFAYGEIHIEKLPFHVCTAMCVLCFLSRRVGFLKKFKLQITMMGFISNLCFLLVPAGVMWAEVHPLCYRAVQTLTFHGVMVVYGFLVLLYERQEFSWKKLYKDLLLAAFMALWALLGNTLYNHDGAFYNWFFVVRDPFFVIPENISRWIMPFLNIAFFMTADLILYSLFWKFSQKKAIPQNTA